MMESSPRLLCVNCGLCINRMHRHRVVELDTRIISLISDWITPAAFNDHDYICNNCYQLAITTINPNPASGQQEAGPSRQIGHRQVCVLCGRSILRRRSNAILRDKPKKLDNAIFNAVSNIIGIEITASDRLCQCCWLKMKRSTQKNNVVDQDINEDPLGSDIDVKPEICFASTIDNTLYIQATTPAPIVPKNEQKAEEAHTNSTITLSNYRRAANTSAHCVFPDCVNSDSHRVSDALRATIIQQYKYYLPVNVRICNQHLQSNNSWESLYDSPKSFATFTTGQIEHVFSLVNKYNSTTDFENVFNIDDRLFLFLFGKSKDDFQTILNDVPRISQMHRGICGLAAYLLKLRSGDSDERIATLFQTPRRTLENLMGKVKKILLEDTVSINLGINHVSKA